MTHIDPNAYTDYAAFEAQLIRSIGAIVGGAELSRVLGYPSQGAFRKARSRGRVPVSTYEIDGRRGRFAQVPDIAAWLWTQRRSPTFRPPHAKGGDSDTV